MAKAITTFEANDGSKHPTAFEASAADLVALLTHATLPLAREMLERRQSVEAVFAELDALEKRTSGPAVRAV